MNLLPSTKFCSFFHSASPLPSFCFPSAFAMPPL